MNSNWFGKLTTSALALTLGTGMLFLSGCDNDKDCDNCEEKTVQTSCCDEVAPIETSYQRSDADNASNTDYSDAARRDVDNSNTSTTAQAAPAPDVNTSVPAAPATPAPDVAAQTPPPAAPAPATPAPAPAPTAQAPAPAPDANAPTVKSEADKSFNVNVNNEINQAPAPKAESAPAGDIHADNDKMHAEAPLSADLQPLSFFEGRWNIEEHFTGGDDMKLGKDVTGTGFFRSSLEGHALIGHKSMKGDKGEYHAMMVITAQNANKGSASAKDLSKPDEAPIATSADNTPGAMNVSANQFSVFYTDSMGHSGMAKEASFDGTKFIDVYQYTNKDGKDVTKRCTMTKESNDKLTFITEKDSGDGFKAFSNGTVTRSADQSKEHHNAK